MAGTLVTTKEGLKPIEEVKIGEYVLSRSEESGETSYKKVTDTLIRSTYNICTIELENGKIKSNTGHLFMVKDKWWKAAAELKVGDILETADEQCQRVKSITVEEKGYPVTTYNLSVEDNHTFFVGKLGVLTHNMKGFTPCELADEVAEKATKGVGEADLLNGKFKDADLESSYQKYILRKNKEGKIPRDRLNWKEARDYWLNDSPMARGNAFNKKAVREGWYDYDEIYLSNGKRLDSYDEISGEIISRKATDLENIDISTFESYLKELKNKYAEGTIIRSNKYPEIDGKPLKGKQILEIPEINKNFSEIEQYVELAQNKYNIEIRFRSE